MSAKTNISLKKGLSFILVALLLGAGAGFVIWLFLYLEHIGITFIWEILPENILTLNPSAAKWFPLFICTCGGVIIGIFTKFFGSYPDDLEEVLEEVKKTNRYAPRLVSVLFFAALLPIVFGGIVGPEAGLAGIIAAVCTYIGDRFKRTAKEMTEMTSVGAAAALSIVFHTPLFGFLASVEGEDGFEFPKKSKVIVYLCTVLSGLGVLLFLTDLFGGGMSFFKFEGRVIARNDIPSFIIFAVTGIVLGYIYNFSDIFFEKTLKPMREKPIICSIFVGVIIGLSGVFLPYVLFSGADSMGEFISDIGSLAPLYLILLALVKILLTNFCVRSTWRGGRILPVVFASICAAGIFAGTDVDFIFPAAVITTVMCGMILRKPLTVIIIMFLFFPASNIILLTASAFLGSYIPLRKNR